MDYLNSNLDNYIYNLSPEEKAKHSLALVIQIHVVSTEELENAPLIKLLFKLSYSIEVIVKQFNQKYDVFINISTLWKNR